MPPSNYLCRFLVSSLLLLLLRIPATGQNYVFAQLTGAPMNTTGWNIAGDARLGNILDSGNTELILCPKALSSSGAAFWGQPINLSLCNKWIAEFDFRMYDGTGADGMAFCFLDVPPTGYVNGGGLGIPNSANGLKVCFDTWNNCIPFDTSTVHFDMPKIEIRYGIGYDNSSDPNNVIDGECLNEPTRDNSDGKISYIRAPYYNHAKITYDSGTVSVYVNDTLYLSAYQQFNFTGYLGFTASTGGYDDNHSIKNVIIYTQMPPSFAGNNQSFCPHDTVQLGGPMNPAYLYTWTPSAGLNDTTLSSPLLHLSNDSSGAQFFTYYVRTSFGYNPGCASVDSVTVQVYPDPKVNFVTPKICLTDAIAQFTDSSYTRDSLTLPFAYLWNFGDPHAGAANPDSSVLQDPAHRYQAAANYQVGLRVTNSMGCVDSASKIFTVNGAVPKASFTIDQPSTLCSNRAVQIANTSSVDFGSIVKIQLYWGDSSMVSYTDSEPYPGKLYSHVYPNPTTRDTESYTIRMISYSGILCQDESDQTLSVLPSPHVQFNPIPPVCTYTAPFVITEATELSQLPGSFAFSGRGISEEGLFNPAAAGPGTDSLLCRFMATDGCVDSAFQVIRVQIPPEVSATHDTSIVYNQPLQLNAVSGDSASLSFLWSPPAGLNDTAISNPVAVLGINTDTIRYTVTVTDSLGCYSQASVEVKVFKTLPDIFVPNAFTPGGASNNIFRPIPVGITSLDFFRVFNRWGQLVYSGSRIGEGWDGMFRGKPQEMGAYVWMAQGVTYEGKTLFRKGTVTLIR